MSNYLDILPHLIAMIVLIACSAFFSGSEAALFFLRPRERRQLREGTPAERAAARLLNDPDRLLSAVLFWNLVINVTYFAIASVAAMDLGRGTAGDKLQAVVFAFVSARMYTTASGHHIQAINIARLKVEDILVGGDDTSGSIPPEYGLTGFITITYPTSKTMDVTVSWQETMWSNIAASETVVLRTP